MRNTKVWYNRRDVSPINPKAIHVIFHEISNCLYVGRLSSVALNALSTYSIMAMHELNIDSDIYGATIVCGSITHSGSINFIKGIDPNSYPVTSYGLEIHGQIGSGSTVKVYAGSLGLSNNFSRTITPLTSENYTVDGRSVSLEEGNRGASVNVNPNLTSKCIKMENDLRTLSNQLTNLPNISTNNISVPISSSGPLRFYVNRVDANGIAAFYMSANTTLNNPFTQNIEVVIDGIISSAVQLIVINLSGTTISYGEGNMNGGWLTSAIGRSKTIWNFKQATTISVTKRWMGAFLAPDASLTTNSDIDGVVAVHCLMSTAKVNDPLLVMPSCV